MAFTYGTITYTKDSNGTTSTAFQVRLGYQLNSQNIENNTSNITLQLEARSINSQYKTYGYNQTTTIDGTTLSAKTFDFREKDAWQIFGTCTFVVSHSADGTYSVSKNGFFQTTASGAGRPYTGSASVVVDLPTIPRTSSFTLSKTSGGSEASSFNLRESIYVDITRASDSFTHKVYFAVGSGGNQSLSTSATTSANGTLNINLANYISTNSSIATMYVDTYSGSTLIGSSSKTFTLNVPDDVKPTISNVATSDTQGKLSVFGAYVQGKSTLRVQTGASGVYGSSIQSCTVQIKNGNTVLQTLSGTDVSLSNISYVGNLTVSVTVTDSRGRTSNVTTTSITVLEYFNPRVDTFSAVRDNSTPTNVTVSINSDIAPLNNNNIKGWLLRYKPTSSSNWVEQNLTSSSYTLNTTVSLTNIDDNVGYDFQLVTTDYFAPDSTNTRDFDLGTSFDLINYKSDGTAVSFGKVSELSNTFECDLDIRLYKKMQLGENESAPWQLFKKEIDLSSFNENTYYPAVSNQPIPHHGLHRVIEAVSLDSETVPSWAEHQSGFSSLIDVLQVYPGWGTNYETPIILNEQYKFASAKPAWYNVITQESKSCFYLRGGGKYYLYTDWKTDWTIHTSAYTYGTDNIVAPTTIVGYSQGLQYAYINKENLFSGIQAIYSSDKTLRLGSQNSSYAHYMTDSNNGHYFNKSIYVYGNVYAGAGYNRMLAYQDEVGQTVGSDGIWTYIKFNNGFAICFAREEKTISVSNSFGDWKASSSQTIDDFPFNFISIPAVSRWVDGGNSGIAMNNGSNKASVSNAGGYQIVRGNTLSNGNFIINTIAVGIWK